jgi:prepilin-type N-terminal cleavage/methylation domain-containing protein
MGNATRRVPGFTLVELMMVVAIVGIMASVAIPNFQRYVLRSKQSERATIVLRIKQQLVQHFIREGALAPRGWPNPVFSTFANWNPPYPPQGGKRPLVNNLPGWNVYFTGSANGDIFPEIEGGLYYSYQFWVIEQPSWSEFIIQAVGDLDSNGVRSLRYEDYWRQTDGAGNFIGTYQRQWQFPPEGYESDEAFTVRGDVY